MENKNSVNQYLFVSNNQNRSRLVQLRPDSHPRPNSEIRRQGATSQQQPRPVLRTTYRSISPAVYPLRTPGYTPLSPRGVMNPRTLVPLKPRSLLQKQAHQRLLVVDLAKSPSNPRAEQQQPTGNHTQKSSVPTNGKNKPSAGSLSVSSGSTIKMVNGQTEASRLKPEKTEQGDGGCEKPELKRPIPHPVSASSTQGISLETLVSKKKTGENPPPAKKPRARKSVPAPLERPPTPPAKCSPEPEPEASPEPEKPEPPKSKPKVDAVHDSVFASFNCGLNAVVDDKSLQQPCWNQMVNNRVLDLPRNCLPPIEKMVKWKTDEVVKFLRSIDFNSKELHDRFKDQLIDGKALLLMTQENFIKLGLKIGPAVKLYHIVLAAKHSKITEN